MHEWRFVAYLESRRICLDNFAIYNYNIIIKLNHNVQDFVS